MNKLVRHYRQAVVASMESATVETLTTDTTALQTPAPTPQLDVDTALDLVQARMNANISDDIHTDSMLPVSAEDLQDDLHQLSIAHEHLTQLGAVLGGRQALPLNERETTFAQEAFNATATLLGVDADVSMEAITQTLSQLTAARDVLAQVTPVDDTTAFISVEQHLAAVDDLAQVGSNLNSLAEALESRSADMAGSERELAQLAFDTSLRHLGLESMVVSQESVLETLKHLLEAVVKAVQAAWEALVEAFDSVFTQLGRLKSLSAKLREQLHGLTDAPNEPQFKISGRLIALAAANGDRPSLQGVAYSVKKSTAVTQEMLGHYLGECMGLVQRFTEYAESGKPRPENLLHNAGRILNLDVPMPRICRATGSNHKITEFQSDVLPGNVQVVGRRPDRVLPKNGAQYGMGEFLSYLTHLNMAQVSYRAVPEEVKVSEGMMATLSPREITQLLDHVDHMLHVLETYRKGIPQVNDVIKKLKSCCSWMSHVAFATLPPGLREYLLLIIRCVRSVGQLATGPMNQTIRWSGRICGDLLNLTGQAMHQYPSIAHAVTAAFEVLRSGPVQRKALPAPMAA